jgi:hypothetical protein
LRRRLRQRPGDGHQQWPRATRSPWPWAWLTAGKLERVVYQPRRHDVAQQFNMADYAEVGRADPREFPVEWRAASGFTEIEIGFDEKAAQEEAKRCLRCDLEWLERVGEPLPKV